LHQRVEDGHVALRDLGTRKPAPMFIATDRCSIDSECLRKFLLGEARLLPNESANSRLRKTLQVLFPCQQVLDGIHRRECRRRAGLLNSPPYQYRVALLTSAARSRYAHSMPREVIFDAGRLTFAQSLGDGWVASYLFIMQDGSPVLAEVHIRPGEEEVPVRFGSPGSDIPSGGLTGRTLAKMRPGSVIKSFLAEWEEDVRREVERATERGDDPIEIEVPAGGWEAFAMRWMQSRRVVPESRIDRLLLVAWLYDWGVTHGASSINKRIAKELGRTPSQVRDDVHAARSEGLLTPGFGRGRVSGTLTHKARALIAERMKQ